MQDVAIWQATAEAATSAASSSPDHAASAQKQSSHLFPEQCNNSEVTDAGVASLASSCALASNRPRWPWSPTFYCWLRWRTPDHGYCAALAYRNCAEMHRVGCASSHVDSSLRALPSNRSSAVEPGITRASKPVS